MIIFFDGMNITGVSGDVIRIEGVSGTRTITAVNYSTHQVTISPAATWVNGAKIYSDYSGNAPDIGAFEVVGETTLAPPSRLRVIE